MQKQTILGIGEILCDIFPDHHCPGGSPMNFCFHINQLGHDGIICSAVGEDEIGQELLDFFSTHGLSTEGIQIHPKYPTGQSIIDVSVPDDPKFEVLKDVAWDYLKLTKTLQKLMNQASAIYYDTLGQRNATSRAVIHQVLDEAPQKCLRVFDVNFKQRFYTRESVEFSLMKANIVKMSLTEAHGVAEMLGYSAYTTLEDLAKWLISAYDIRQVCVTRGGDGCFLLERTPGGMHYVKADMPGMKIDLLDTVGCGDGFTAALIFARLQEWELAKQGEFANWIGSVIASSKGGSAPHPEKVKKLVRKMAEEGR